jgi:hypothetical protein
MSVYVDEPIWPFGRMMMCHMVADSRAELDAMADTIGVARKWIQKPDTDREHYDICKSKRAKAVALGSVEISCADLAQLVRADGRPVR